MELLNREKEYFLGTLFFFILDAITIDVSGNHIGGYIWKRIGKKAENPKLTREYFVEGLEFTERLKKELGCEIKMLNGIRNQQEPLILKCGKIIAQICPRKGVLFSVYRFWKAPKVVKLTNESEIEELFNDFAEHCKQLEQQPKKVIAKISKQNSADIIKEIESRIKKLSPKHKGIHMPPGTATAEVRRWAKEKGYTLSGDTLLVNRAE